jgi:hypothetical protein
MAVLPSNLTVMPFNFLPSTGKALFVQVMDQDFGRNGWFFCRATGNGNNPYLPDVIDLYSHALA